MGTIGLVAAAAGGVQSIRAGIVEPLVASGHQVAITLTPTAHSWLSASGEIAPLEKLTGLPVRGQPRLPGEPRPHPPVDVFVAAPLSANSVAKLALGLADNQALTVLSEAVATVPMIVFPRVNAAHARHPAWPDHLAALRSAGVQLVVGDDVWPLVEPRSDDDRPLPWPTILDLVSIAAASHPS